MVKKFPKRKVSPLGNMMKTGVTNIVGVGLIGASAGMVNALPAGTAKTVAGIVPGLQSVSLVGENLKPFTKKKGFGY